MSKISVGYVKQSIKILKYIIESVIKSEKSIKKKSIQILNYDIQNNKSVKILIAYHMKTPLLKNDICIPIHCGRALGRTAHKNGYISQKDYEWMLDNMIGDDTGDNISMLNRKFNEMTAIYWTWKNYDKLGNPDYIGFMHYRTLYVFMDYPAYYNNYLDCMWYNKETLNKILHNQDFVCTRFYKYQQNAIKTFKSMQVHGADVTYWSELLNILKEKYPDDYKSMTKFLKQRNTGPYKNMFITSKKEFFKYCEWIFPKLFELDERLSYKQESRSIGYLSEQLTAYYFWMLAKKGYKYKEFYTFKPFPDDK